MGNLASIIEEYRDELVDSVVYDNASDIDTVADVLGIDRDYLSAQVRLHIPYYSLSEIQSRDSISVVRDILCQLRSRLADFSDYHRHFRANNGVDSIVYPNDVDVVAKSKGGRMWIARTPQERELRCGTVPESSGFAIQEHLHYIHCSRKDTGFHFGLYMEDYSEPLCYAAFSDLKREYLKEALCSALPIKCRTPQKVAVMTRAFGFSPLPKNMMSLLFGSAVRLLSQQGYDYVITAVNPFLGFEGIAFAGSNFWAFATSPMEYKYNADRQYLTRSGAKDNFTVQKYPTPSILWLVTPLRRKDRQILEKEGAILCHITQDEYAKG